MFFAAIRDRVGPREVLRDAAWKLCGHRDFGAPWRRDAFDREAALDAAVVHLVALARVAAAAELAGDEYLTKALDKVRRFADECPLVVVASSFSKSLSLYSERVGALSIVTASADEAKRALSHVKRVVRANYSGPTSYGGGLEGIGWVGE